MSKLKRVADAPRRRLKNILVLHGPNLNLLGAREPRIYGKETIQSINERLSRMARSEGATLQVFQSNHEGALIERIQGAKQQRISWIIVNPRVDPHQRGASRRLR